VVAVTKVSEGCVQNLIFILLACLVFSPAWAKIQLQGDFIQGGMVIGQGAQGAQVWQDGKPVRVSDNGVFILGFGRDMPKTSALKIRYADGSVEQQDLIVKRREYAIQRIDGLPKRHVTPRSKEDLKRIRRDITLAKKARKRDDARLDFMADFIWPATGPISGVYGSQRILNGKPRRPHFGVDIARPTGTPVVAPADGIITLAEPDMFFSGGTLIIDHGHRLTSSMLHLHKILVKVGDSVKQGQVIAQIGATGRVTGPHLDWRMNLRGHRIDPQLLVPPMPQWDKGQK
jgi:murein DD-endopeptidase MepM/ murein hydrolase activator NlpD